MKNPARRLLLLAAASLVAAGTRPASAQPVAGTGERRAGGGGVVVERAWTRAVAASSPVAVGYMTLRNEGPAPDRLLSASTPLARAVELHESTLDGGVARMRPLPEGVPLPPGAAVRLEPGGAHAMLLGPARAFARGERVPLTLRFERAGAVAVELTVEGPGARQPSTASGGDGGAAVAAAAGHEGH